jgi:hypothetical protein
MYRASKEKGIYRREEREKTAARGVMGFMYNRGVISGKRRPILRGFRRLNVFRLGAG